MADTRCHVIVPLTPADAFATFVEQVDKWWPRQGVFPFSFAPSSTRPGHIRFEPGLNGRFYETFADETEYEIGRIVHWEPPARLVHTWQDPSWAGDTEVTITFGPHETGAEVVQEQDGFAAIGQADLIPYYDIGNRQVMGVYAAHCRAVAELRALQNLP